MLAHGMDVRNWPLPMDQGPMIWAEDLQEVSSEICPMFFLLSEHSLPSLSLTTTSELAWRGSNGSITSSFLSRILHLHGKLGRTVPIFTRTSKTALTRVGTILLQIKSSA